MGDGRWKILREGIRRNKAVVLFTGLTAHDWLENHLYKIRVAESTNYTLCDLNQPMTFEHVNACDVLLQFENIVKMYWRVCNYRLKC